MEKKNIFKTNFRVVIMMTAFMLTLTSITVLAQKREVVPVKKNLIDSMRLAPLPTHYLKLGVVITEHPKDVTIKNPGYYAIEVPPITLSVKVLGSSPISYTWFYKLQDQIGGGIVPSITYQWEPVPQYNSMFSGMRSSSLTITLGVSDGFLYEFKCLVQNEHKTVWSNRATVNVTPPAPR